MVTVIRAQRRSPVLTPSSLACLSRIPTINLTAGCAIGCVYCYAVGYASYPGDGKVVLYENTLEVLKQEFARKRTKPRSVYFSPSSDLFQPVPEVLDLSHRILEFLFSKDVGVAFLTKGYIPDDTMRLLLGNANRVQEQIGIIALDEALLRSFEPNAASPAVRLGQIAKLIAGGVPTAARLAPVLPGITDTPAALGRLFSALAKVGVTRAVASTLFLRPSIAEFMKGTVTNEKTLEKLLDNYRYANRLAVRAERSSVTALPRAHREKVYANIDEVAKEHGITLSICACMNPDLARGTCGISGSWPRKTQPAGQPRLFDMER